MLSRRGKARIRGATLTHVEITSLDSLKLGACMENAVKNAHPQGHRARPSGMRQHPGTPIHTGTLAGVVTTLLEHGLRYRNEVSHETSRGYEGAHTRLGRSHWNSHPDTGAGARRPSHRAVAPALTLAQGARTGTHTGLRTGMGTGTRTGHEHSALAESLAQAPTLALAPALAPGTHTGPGTGGQTHDKHSWDAQPTGTHSPSCG